MSKYSEEERAKYAGCFDTLRKDESGCVSISELYEALKDHCTGGDHDKAIDITSDVKQKCDKDDEDRITKGEFMGALAEC